jgi:glycosyltransferase involved in cell wall biosynthesis
LSDAAPRPQTVTVVTCYRQPDYTRAISLRRAVAGAGYAVDVVKNRSTGVRRYAEVASQLLRRRGARRPDAYLVTFRAYEILPLVMLLAGGRPVIYDEFINPVEWFVEEHRKLRAGGLGARLLRSVFRLLMRRSAGILADTASHAEHSAELMGIPSDRFTVVPVGADEQTFRPVPVAPRPAGPLRVLYYGSMLPLHGLDVVLDACLLAAQRIPIELGTIGGDSATMAQIAEAEARGLAVQHRRWVDYERLPDELARFDLLLGGPFGGTPQAQYVVTGKTYQFLASGRPTVIGVNRESGAFSDRRDALVVPQSDPAALADAFVWAHEHPEELREIGARGRALYERLFSEEHIVAALAPALRTALAGNAGDAG